MSAIHLQPACTTPRAVPRRDAHEALADAADWALCVWRKWRQRARERAELAQLDDRTLRDIGLTRADREFLANKPFWRE